MINRVKPLGWAFLEILTSGQMTQLDVNAAMAVDGATTDATGLVISARSVTRFIGGHAQPDASGIWLFSANNYWQTNANTSGSLIWNFQLPKGYTITGYSISLIGKGGHAGQPGTMPKLDLVACTDPVFGGTALIGTQSDVWTNAGAYQVAHQITKAGLAYTALDPANGWFAFIFTSESGANALDTLKVGAQPKITFIASRIDEL